MAFIRNLWSVRALASRSAAGRPAPARPPASPPRGAIVSAAKHASGIDFEHPIVAEPNPALLRTAGQKLLQAARASGRSPALAVMQVGDLHELEHVFGRSGADRVVDAAMAELTRAAAGKGLAVRTAADTFALLMPGGGATGTLAAIHARLGTPCTIEVGSGRDEILALPDLMVLPLGPQDSIAQVYGDLCRYIAKARQHGQGVRTGVPQATAAGGRATDSPRVAAAGVQASQHWPPLPATIPVPLGLH